MTRTQIIIVNRGKGFGKGTYGTSEFYTADTKKLKTLIPILLNSAGGFVTLCEKVKNDPEILLDDFFSQKYQGVANCTWASPKAVFLTLLYALDENRKIDKEKSLKTAKRFYKKFTNKQRITVLHDYLKTTPVDLLLPEDLLREIHRKLKKKTSPDYLSAKGIKIDSGAKKVSTKLKKIINRLSSGEKCSCRP